MASRIIIKPMDHPSDSSVKFGAILSNVDIENLTGANISVLRNALFNHEILVIRNQRNTSARAQYNLTRCFDPAGHKSVEKLKARIMPDQPELQIIGNGFVPEYQGLKNLRMRYPHHRESHITIIPDDDGEEFTRFYRWHIDAMMYGDVPPVATTILAVRLPERRTQTVRYDDGTGDEVEIPLGGIAFASGETMYNLLSEEDKKFVRSTMVEYASYPYLWVSKTKSNPTGLGLATEEKELDDANLPAADPTSVRILPLCWRNPITGNLALMIEPSAAHRLHLANGEVIDDLRRVREMIYRLQRPAIAPQQIYTHDWQQGDLLIFHNRGLIHTLVGTLNEDDVRLMRQCFIAGSEMPRGPEIST